MSVTEDAAAPAPRRDPATGSTARSPWSRARVAASGSRSPPTCWPAARASRSPRASPTSSPPRPSGLGGPDWVLAPRQRRRRRGPRRHRRRDRRALRAPRRAGEQHRHQPGRRAAHDDRPGRRLQDLDVNVVAALGFCSRRTRRGSASTAAASSTSPRSPGCVHPRHRRLRRLEGRRDPAHRGAGRRAGAAHPRQRGGAGDREDALRTQLYEHDEQGVADRIRSGGWVPGGRRVARGFLCTDAASWITGETLRIDGGTLATGSV